MHYMGCLKRGAEIELAAKAQGVNTDVYRSAAYRELAIIAAKVADTERMLRLQEGAAANTAAHAFQVLRTVELSSEQALALAEILLDQLTSAEERGEPVAWARTFGADRLVTALKNYMDEAVELDPYVRDAQPMPGEYDADRRHDERFEQKEAA